jgi:hypothetical protein
MRFLMVGFLVLAMPAMALAQARGQVLAVGFNNHYRPDCWTPMLVQLTSQSPDSQTYQIQIVQEDLDRDRVTYTQLETLGGNIDGKPATTENYWVFFKPKPTDGGLPDATNMTTTLNTLNGQLKVFLCDKDGKQLSTLPLTSTILNVDPVRPAGDTMRSRKLILFVTDGTDKPEISDYSTQKGVLEDVDAVTVSPRDLPSNVIGYEGVDAIVWMDADANFLVSGTHTPSLEAILQWVHQGGHLVICQPAEAFKIKPFAEILPVGAQINGEWTIPTVDRTDLEPLEQLAHPTVAQADWPAKLGTFKVGRATALAGAKVDQWLRWTDGGKVSFTPWLARRGVGLGAVTWVAQDLGNPELTQKAHAGWRYVWDQVFDWNNPKSVPEDYKPLEGIEDFWGGAEGIDLGKPLLKGLELTHTAAALISIAIVSFILYWVIAGPGIYFLLLWRKQTHLSWFLFGLTAVAATGLTALLVKAVVRGSPKLHHLSVVRYAAGESDGVIDSRFGLYIPQDGTETIGLGETAPHEVSYLTPFSLHPQYADSSDDQSAYLEYQIPVRNDSETDPVSVSIPYRSSSKDFQAHWVGEIKGTIDVDGDAVKLDTNNKLVGTLVNHTGCDLYHVFLGFKKPGFVDVTETGTRDTDIIAYVDKWAKDDSLKLGDLVVSKNSMDLEDLTRRQPMGADPAYGEIGGIQKLADAWSSFWRGKEDAVAGDLDYALPMLTFFDQLPPWPAESHTNRYELYRRGARDLDLSPALSAGGLVICGRGMVNGDVTRSPLPAPLMVGDSPVNGDGTTIYQFVLPLDRSAVYREPSTKPDGK